MPKNKTKSTRLFALLVATCFAFNCNQANKSTVAENKAINGETAKTENSAVSNAVANSAPINSQKSSADKTANAQKVQTNELQPRKINDNAAVSPVYPINSANCQNKDEQGSEGDEFVRKCKGYGKYSLWAEGFENQINYRIEPDDMKSEFITYLAPLEAGDADEYRRADRFVQKLGDKIEWILDEQGKPFAVFVRAAFYKNTGNVKSSISAKNKVTEFVFLRGLDGFKEIDNDIQAVDTAYNPDEWARKIAYEGLEARKN